jgi:hypothetical protein
VPRGFPGATAVGSAALLTYTPIAVPGCHGPRNPLPLRPDRQALDESYIGATASELIAFTPELWPSVPADIRCDVLSNNGATQRVLDRRVVTLRHQDGAVQGAWREHGLLVLFYARGVTSAQIDAFIAGLREVPGPV